MLTFKRDQKYKLNEKRLLSDAISDILKSFPLSLFIGVNFWSTSNLKVH